MASVVLVYLARLIREVACSTDYSTEWGFLPCNNPRGGVERVRRLLDSATFAINGRVFECL